MRSVLQLIFIALYLGALNYRSNTWYWCVIFPTHTLLHEHKHHVKEGEKHHRDVAYQEEPAVGGREAEDGGLEGAARWARQLLVIREERIVVTIKATDICEGDDTISEDQRRNTHHKKENNRIPAIKFCEQSLGIFG